MVGIRKLRANLSMELKEMPFKITRNGKVVAVVGDTINKIVEEKSQKKKVDNDICEHGQMRGVCKFGCK